MELVRSGTGPAARLGADGLDGVDGGEHHLRIVHVRGAHQDRERDAVGVDHKMALRALFAAIRWVLARFLAPPGAGTAAESSAARSQSMRSAWASSSRSTWCSLRQTPAWYQSRSLRQHVIPLPASMSRCQPALKGYGGCSVARTEAVRRPRATCIRPARGSHAAVRGRWNLPVARGRTRSPRG